MAKIVLAVYGVLMLGGGFMGYAKAGSKMSLIMGTVSAIVIFTGLYLSKPKFIIPAIEIDVHIHSPQIEYDLL